MYSSFKDNIWGANLADMQLISKYNKETRLLLCAIDAFSKKYACAFLLKDKKVIAIANASQKALIKSRRKPNKIWVDKGSKFYNRSMKSWLQGSDTEMYSAHNKEKSVVAKRFNKTLKNKFCKYPTLISRNVYNDKLDDIVNQNENY